MVFVIRTHTYVVHIHAYMAPSNSTLLKIFIFQDFNKKNRGSRKTALMVMIVMMTHTAITAEEKIKP